MVILVAIELFSVLIVFKHRVDEAAFQMQILCTQCKF